MNKKKTGQIIITYLLIIKQCETQIYLLDQNSSGGGGGRGRGGVGIGCGDSEGMSVNELKY